MNKEIRLSIIEKLVEERIFPSLEINDLIEAFIIDELKYAGSKAYKEKRNINKEFKKVLDAYSFNNYKVSFKVKNYITHYSANPIVASMQHFGSFVYYIGEYYDGTLIQKEENK